MAKKQSADFSGDEDLTISSRGGYTSDAEFTETGTVGTGADYIGEHDHVVSGHFASGQPGQIVTGRTGHMATPQSGQMTTGQPGQTATGQPAHMATPQSGHTTTGGSHMPQPQPQTQPRAQTQTQTKRQTKSQTGRHSRA
jgi:hypothetical protein